MAEICPHCGAQLPVVRDAFCSECHNDLEDPPLAASETAADSGQDDADANVPGGASYPRPVGITLMAILLFGSGVAILAMQFLLIGRLQELEGPLRAVGIPPVLVVLGVVFLGLLGTTAGVGMWFGKKWGWSLGAFYLVYAIARYTSAIIIVAGLPDTPDAGSRGRVSFFAKQAGRIIVHLLILLYFFKGNVLHYFELQDLPRWKALLKMIGACATIGGIARVIAWLAS
jgi:hypothetical protein